MFIPAPTETARGYYRVVDEQHGMTLYLPYGRGRARLAVNPIEAFQEKTLRSRRVNRATLTWGCPVGRRITRGMCEGGLVLQNVYYAEDETERIVREFFRGQLQERYLREQKKLRGE